MLTLENIGLNEQDENEIVISFSYEGIGMDFRGQIKMSKDDWIASKLAEEDDSEMIERLVQRELNHWINR
ncbi:hypothetical protein [Neobacillus mesonae]|uniref:hypothetical protein n=1 Tax=Neobacillus mesonae TaxID=1193713 RepID=UPI00257338CF|nr:hypothetical protein [Neobacillus mesonae]